MRTFIILALIVATCYASPWTENQELQLRQGDRKAHKIPNFNLNLDLPPEDRWTEIAAAYKDTVPAMMDYIDAFIPAWARKIVFGIAADIDSYKGFGDYSDEMKGLSKALDVDLGVVVVANLIYQLENIGQNCSTWNNTGPGCPSDWEEETDEEKYNSPGLCTSIVAEDVNGTIYHGRNLDWNLPLVLRQNMINVNYQKGGKTIFTGTQMVPFVGILNGIKPGVITYSMDARGRGGNILTNFWEMLMYGAQTPAQHARRVLESATSFEDGVKQFDTPDLVNEVYYILGGSQHGEGLVLTRNRNPPNDLWWLNATGSDEDWYRLETNYDHWKGVPKADNRRDPGNAMMMNMTQAGLNTDNLLGIMKTWPLFNHHTDFTGLFSAKNGEYISMYWDDGSSN